MSMTGRIAAAKRAARLRGVQIMKVTPMHGTHRGRVFTCRAGDIPGIEKYVVKLVPAWRAELAPTHQ
jgi:hypothetical protein